MGDDTWLTAFPDTFQANLSFPYDSFNVEDLHTVDEGVVRHLFPLLHDDTNNNKPFDFLIGHFLGVDHVGHRLGPDHPSMFAKLEQMNKVLTRVVEMLDDDTLLVVLGDHGMDRTGDHGGDGELETSSGLWIYSKGRPLTDTRHSTLPPPPQALLRTSVFPGTTVPHRSVQQIDLVPSLSLLLGLPVPFNNLGTVIPELFWRDREGTTLLAQALEITATQINKYLNVYHDSPSGGELSGVWSELQSLWSATAALEMSSSERMVALDEYNRFALATCRSLWAQFNPVLMGLGLTLLGTGLLVTCALYLRLLQEKDWNVEQWLGIKLWQSLHGIAGGAVIGLVFYLSFGSRLPEIDALDCVLFTAPLLSSIVLAASARPKITISIVKSVPIALALHILTFLSNSFTIWEDRIITFLLVSSITPAVLTGFTAPTTRLRYRILGFSLLFAVCVRLISISTVCREEQQSYCHMTFFASSSLPSPPGYILVLALPVSFGLPSAIRRFLSISKSDRGTAQTFLPWILRPALVASSLYWIIEWADSASVLGPDWSDTLRDTRTMVARLAMGAVTFGGMVLWWPAPICMDIRVRTASGDDQQKKVTVLGFANAFGSPYFIFWAIFLSIVYTTTQLTGQVVLALGTIALLAYLEVVDSVRDVESLGSALASTAGANAPPPLKFSEIVPLALLGLHLFHGTGHQSVISTIQWKSAFLLTPTVKYPFSAITIVTNSLGAQFLIGLAVPLLAMWNRAPFVSTTSPPSTSKKTGQVRGGTDVHVRKECVRAALGMMIYYAALLFGSAASVAVLRRHLMVWKVFAPRFMSATLGLLVVDVGVLVGMGIGVARVWETVHLVFGDKKKA
jgi:phosphatidylinositol glycan class O